MTEEQIFQLAGNYGAVALLFAWFIFQYFKEKRVADTLKTSNTDKKADTDEVAREINSKQEVCLEGMRKDIEFIKSQVSNHLPTSIKELSDKMDKHIADQNIFEKDILVKVAKI
jgi:hypothetical protein